MPLSEQQLSDDLRRAMKARDMTAVYALRAVTAAVKNLKVERRGSELSEADLVEIVRREVRKRQEAEDYARQAGRDELVQQNASERAILEPYLPALLTGPALEKRVREIVAAKPGAAMGQVMAALKAAYAGRYEGREASEVVRRVLAERPAE
ncbi:MAG TPA: GatB/YqeY domain-containing protein [Candidatus Limnocylindria bacterium]|nr:GatB/YqeY domain-containing protein [Candidatus Limnocylindria bacterium]